MTATSQRDAWQRAQLERILDDVVREAAGGDVALTLHEVRALLAERLQGRPTRANFRTGHLTICTLGADALGPAPGRLPARPRRRRVPAQGAPRRRRHHARRPARRRPRPAPRGPPDAARRADGGERPPDRHLRGQRRAHEHAAPARRAGRGAARRDRPHGPGRRPRAGARPPPAPALRPAQLQPRRAGRRARLELQPRHARRRPRDAGRARRAAAVPDRPAPARHLAGGGARGRRATSSATRCGRSSASGSASAWRPTPTRSTTPCPIDLDNLESWQIGQRLLDARLAGATGDAAVGAELARGSLPPGNLSGPVIDKLLPQVEQIVQHAAALLPGGGESGLGRRAGHAPGRPARERHGPGRVRDAAAERHLLAREPAAPADDVGALPRADGRAPGARVRGGDGGPRGVRRRPARDERDGRAAAADGTRSSPWSASTPWWSSSTRAGASRCRSPASPRPPTRRRCTASAIRSRPRRASGTARGTSRARARTSSTRWPSGVCCAFDELLASYPFDAYARRLWDDVLAWEQVEHR